MPLWLSHPNKHISLHTRPRCRRILFKPSLFPSRLLSLLDQRDMISVVFGISSRCRSTRRILYRLNGILLSKSYYVSMFFVLFALNRLTLATVILSIHQQKHFALFCLAVFVSFYLVSVDCFRSSSSSSISLPHRTLHLPHSISLPHMMYTKSKHYSSLKWVICDTLRQKIN